MVRDRRPRMLPPVPPVPLELDATAASAATATDAGAVVRLRGDSLRVGDVVAHFRVDRRIGEGGMGEVWLATDLSLDRQVAIKVLLPGVAGDPSRRERLTREARAQARIRHPNVCHIYYIGEDLGRVFFVMEYVQGESLAERLTRQRLRADEAIELMRMAALGLREAYRNGFRSEISTASGFNSTMYSVFNTMKP